MTNQLRAILLERGLIFPKGRKTLVDCDRERYRTDSRLVGPVKIGGKRYDCIAVECTQLAKPTIHVGEVIGLVVQSARCPFRATLGRNGTIGGLHIATIMQLRAASRILWKRGSVVPAEYYVRPY